MLNQKEAIILRLLYENMGICLTSQKIAKKLNVSSKTCRKYINFVKNVLQEELIATIKAKQGYGYQLDIYDKEAFEKFYEKVMAQLSLKENVPLESEAKQRQNYLLNCLFFEQDSIYLENLLDELFISESTLINDLTKIKKLLEPYNIKLKSKANAGIYVIGQEEKCRQFMMDYFFISRLENNNYAFLIYEDLLGDIDIEDIFIILLDECRNAKLKISDFIIRNLAIHIALSINRLKAGFEIESHPTFDISTDSLEYQVAIRIIKRMTASFGINFPDKEALYITVHLQSKSVPMLDAESNMVINRRELKSQIMDVLKKLSHTISLPMDADDTLIKALLMHFSPFLERLKHSKLLENPLLDEIKSEYGFAFNLTINAFREMPFLKNYVITEAEWGYLTLHINASIFRLSNVKKLRVILIAGIGAGHAQMIKERLEYECGSKIELVDVINYHEMLDIDLNQIDLIISSVHLPIMLHNIPTILVSSFFNESDLQKINQSLASYKNKSVYHMLKHPEDHRKKRCEDKSRLIDLCFSEDLFFKINGKTSKEKVLKALLCAIEEKEGEPIKEKLLKQLQLRESYFSVAFSDDVALPHPLEAVTKNYYVAVAILQKGIRWDKEHLKVRLVLLVSPGRRSQIEMNDLNELLIPITIDETFKNELIDSLNFESFKEKLMIYIKRKER